MQRTISIITSLTLLFTMSMSAGVEVASAATATKAAQQQVTPKAKVATKKTGRSQFVLRATVSQVGGSTVVVRVTGTTKNVSKLKQTDQTLTLMDTTKITKAGKKIALSSLTAGTKVKVFGIYDKNTSSLSKIQWIKVL